ncbi:MAG: lipoprotein [Ruminococcus sp.]|nr:lipoprotein [Ruminococcus sp.]
MKKYVIFLIALAALSGCSDNEDSDVSDAPAETTVSEATTTEVSVPEETTAPEVTTTTAEIPEETTAEITTTAAEIPEEITIPAVEKNGYTYRVESDGVVCVSGGIDVEKLYTDCTELLRLAEAYGEDPAELLTIEDFDFDGYDDVFVPETIGTPNVPGKYFRQVPEANSYYFGEWDELNGIGFLLNTDSVNERLTFYSKGSAVEHEQVVYEWEGSAIVPVSRELQYMQETEIFIDSYEYDGGKEILTGRKRVLLGENNEWLGTEDVPLTD